MKKIISLLVFSFSFLVSFAQTYEYKQVWSADKGDGTYVNPIVNGDFPDMDVVRVGDTYYMASTTMFLMPGGDILESKDLVHWDIAAHVFDTLGDDDQYELKNGKHAYARGMWTPSLRYDNGTFY